MELAVSRAEDLQVEFGGHESFPFRYGWLKKAVDVVREDPEIFQSDEAIVRFGVGKNMVRSIRHWGLATGMLEEEQDGSSAKQSRLTVSELGASLLADDGWDPHLEDRASLWIVHWSLLSNSRRSTTWYLAFNLLHRPEFTREQVQDLIHENLKYRGLDRSPNTIERDVRCFVQTYSRSTSNTRSILASRRQCPLAELGLINEIDEGRLYSFNIGPKMSLPSEIFGYALVQYSQASPGLSHKTISVEDCTWGEGSPGQAFKLDEETIIEYHLGRLEEISRGHISIDDTAGLRQVYFREDLDPTLFLRRYYERNK